jgi:hypothetical protein
MASVSSPRQSEFAPVDANFEQLPRVVRALPDGMTRPTDRQRKRPSLVRRAARGLIRFLVVFCIGVATTLAWQSHGDAARMVIANSSPQLGWLAPQAAPFAQTAPDQVAPAAARSLDQLQLKEVSLGLSAVRQSVDQLAAQLTAGQRQMAGDIAKLQAEISAPPPQPAAAPARKPVPPTPAPPVR